MDQLFSPLIERAMRVAARSHREQRRKASDLPYLSHPASVALILLKAGFDDDFLLAAALLHDVVEDTDYTAARLAEEFPPAVVQIVQALSERKTDEQGRKRPWMDRKTEHLRDLAGATVEAKAVMLADKLHNLGCMLLDYEREGESMWGRFNAPKAEVFWYHAAMIDAADCGDPRVARMQQAARAVLERLKTASD